MYGDAILEACVFYLKGVDLLDQKDCGQETHGARPHNNEVPVFGMQLLACCLARRRHGVRLCVCTGPLWMCVPGMDERRRDEEREKLNEWTCRKLTADL